MSRTLKDSRGSKLGKSTLEVAKRQDGAFDIFLNQQVLQLNVQEKWLPEWLCVRFGFCGEEYAMALSQLHQTGQVALTF